MSNIDIELTPAKEYLIFLADKCKQFCSVQQNIENSYKRLGFQWEDKVYTATGQEIKETARAISQVYEMMDETIKKLQRRIEDLCEYNDTPAPDPLYVPEFEIRVLPGTPPANERIKTEPQALTNFERDLQEYINNVVTLISGLKNKHEEMHDHWQDQHYYHFSSVVEEVNQKINIQVSRLDILNTFIEKKKLILLRTT